jgi:hypothetical protein
MVVISVAFLIIQAIIYFSISNDASTNVNDGTAKPSTTIIVIMAVFGVPIGLLLLTLIGFLIFHCILKARGKTTREFIKDRRAETAQELQSNKDSELGKKNKSDHANDLKQPDNNSNETRPITVPKADPVPSQGYKDAQENIAEEARDIESEEEENDLFNVTPVYLDFGRKITAMDAARIAELKL